MLVKSYREIVNYFFIRKTIRQQQNTPDWARFNLRVDWISRIYTVISLNEDFVSKVSSLEITQEIIDQMQPINNYLTILNLQEIIYPVITRIKDTNSWLIVYNPLFKILTFKNILITISLIILSILTYTYFDELKYAVNHLF